MDNQIVKAEQAVRQLDPGFIDSFDVTMNRSLSMNTRAGYSSDVKEFNRWLTSTGRTMNVDSIAAYFSSLAESDTLQAATLNRKKYSIMRAVKALFPEPKRTAVLNAIRQSTETYQTDPAVDTDAILSKDQVETLAAAADSRLSLIIEFLWRTAVRVSELTSIRRIDIEQNGRVSIRIRGKGRKERTVKVPAEFYNRVRDTFHGEKYLFETTGGRPYARSNIYIQLQRLARRISFQSKVTPHTFRHSRATYLLLEAEQSLKAVSRMLGHSSTSITADLYIHDSIDYDSIFEADNGFGSENDEPILI